MRVDRYKLRAVQHVNELAYLAKPDTLVNPSCKRCQFVSSTDSEAGLVGGVPNPFDATTFYLWSCTTKLRPTTIAV